MKKQKPSKNKIVASMISGFREWLNRGKTNAWTAIILLAIAIFTNTLAIYYQLSGNFLEASNNARMAAFLWALSVLLSGLSAWFFAETSKESIKARIEISAESQNQTLPLRVVNSIRAFVLNKTFLSLFPILLLAFILRVTPMMNHGLFVDEWYWLDNAKQIIKGVVVSPFGFIGDQPSNLPAYPLALLLLIVRNPLLAVRLIGVIYSLIAISLVYALVNKTLGFKASICGSLLMAVSVWDIHMSALGWLNVNPNPMLVAGVLLLLYLVWRNVYTPRTLFGLAVLVAIGVHLLYVAVLLVIPAFLLLSIHWGRNRNKKSLKEIVLFSIFFFVSISPLIPKLIRYPESVSRHREFIQQNVTLSDESKTPLSYYWDQLLLLGDDYVWSNVNFGHQALWGITFDPLIRLLSLLGILLIIIQVFRKKTDPFWLVLILSFFIQLFIPFILLYRSSSAWRAYLILPIVYLFTVYAMVEISLWMVFITKQMILNKKGVLTTFLAVIMSLYFIINFSWFREFFNYYTARRDIYENTICQRAAKLVDQQVPRGSTIYMPDEMCFPLISILFNEDQYHFINVRLEDTTLDLASGDYVIIFNSWRYSGYFNNDIQGMLQQKLNQLQTELLTLRYTSLPVLFLIR